MADMNDATLQAETCGLCGPPLNADHSHAEATAGTHVEYEVVGVRGVLADSVALHEPGDKHRLPAWVLATNLGVDAGSLVGVRYTCLVACDPYGTTRSDYRLSSSGSLPPRARPGG
ncbi:hypothetical protein [Streptomyces griseosporeus]|uniref:hypothetical protein n=1 Tax=Streptomyces griseosporeus TaxID=1910 RepID=UPI00379369DF